MAGLLTNPRLGNTNTSSLVKSAGSISTALANYQDQIQALTFANSAYTDDAFSTYQNYLQGRINNLNGTGSITNASKALTLTKTMEGAMHSNISASIQRENIQILAGNATLPDKYNLIVSQYQRAVNNGDMTLAQTLESQAYSVSQSIQYQAQQAADAQAALARANAGARSAANAAATTYQSQTVSNLEEALKSFTGTAKNLSEKQLNANLAAYVNDPNTQKALNALGVKIGTAQPNYWDVVSGVAGAIYNHKVLQAQAESLTNPLVSLTYASQAQDMITGVHKFTTLAGDLTAQQITQAQQDPQMFAYDNTNGTYKPTAIIGYQYMNMTNQDGTTKAQLVPTYSGIVGDAKRNQVYFLNPIETAQMTKLGLNFSENTSGKNAGTTGDGVQVQLTNNSPTWLQSVLGKGGIANLFTDSNGYLTFKAGGSNGQEAFYTLATDNRGLSGVFEHRPDGSIQNVGGDYGFSAQAVQLLINQGQQVQGQLQVEQAKVQAQLKVQQMQAQQALQVQQAAAQAAALRVATLAPAQHAPTQTARLQPAVSPQLPNFNPQGNNVNPQANNVSPQSTINGFNLNQSGSGGIRLRVQ